MKIYEATGVTIHDQGRVLQPLTSELLPGETCPANGFIASEFLSGGNIEQIDHSRHDSEEEFRRKWTEKKWASLIYLIIEAVEQFWSHLNMVHCDLKGENIMLRVDPDTGDRVPVLIDYGAAVDFGEKCWAYTKSFASPYYAHGIYADPNYDMYSIGKIALFTLCRDYNDVRREKDRTGKRGGRFSKFSTVLKGSFLRRIRSVRYSTYFEENCLFSGEVQFSISLLIVSCPSCVNLCFGNLFPPPSILARFKK